MHNVIDITALVARSSSVPLPRVKKPLGLVASCASYVLGWAKPEKAVSQLKTA